ncbi:6-phosphogluconolactonase [Anaerolineales bacterium]|nr:6-phosphogluconolactonase [Anaerolineales bacterium]
MARKQSRLGWRFFVLLATMTLALGAGFAAAEERQDFPGAVYTMSNAAGGNEILVFKRGANGMLTPAGSVPTGGLGTGAGLGNQGAVVLSRDNQWLYAVNAGSNEISVFAVDPEGLTLVETVPSGGEIPISLTVDRKLLYVLHAGGRVGGVDTITGFTIGTDGKLSPLPGSTKPLSADNTNPAQVGFTPDGDVLVVTEKATNIIDTYTVGKDGLASAPMPHPSAGTTPFGFAFGKRSQLFVSEAAGGAPDGSSASSYLVSGDGGLTTISPSVPTTETAACWAQVSNDGRFAYVANAGSGSVSGYRIAHDGTIALLDADGRTGVTGAGPTDMAFSNNGRFLYALRSGSGAISAFRAEADGNLLPLPGISGMPAGANGLAVW